MMDRDQLPGETTMRRPVLTIEDYVNGVIARDRALLARAITLIESDADAHKADARAVLEQLLPHAGKSIRIGITGTPGAGKSTLIERLGLHLIREKLRVAVLAIDPTSSRTQGSILGDKTRMEELSHSEQAFVRPSPTRGLLGGVARKTRESILLCEAAGYDVILVETVGTGQSEVAVRSMVDFFLLLLIPGGGDELQGIKRGVVELADAIFINKADSDNRIAAQRAAVDYTRALRFLHPATPGWTPVAQTCSALENRGVAEIWHVIERFRAETQLSGAFAERRRLQNQEWFRTLIADELQALFYRSPAVASSLPDLEAAVGAGTVSVRAAVSRLLAAFTDATS